jgi:hypothetical protein
MGGLLTHLSVAGIGFSVIFLLFHKHKWKYFFAIAFAFGHLFPDLLDFGITGILNRTLNPVEIVLIPLFDKLRWLGHTGINWIIFGLIGGISLFLFYKFEKISKKQFVNSMNVLSFFLLGIAIHLLIDVLIIEKSYWI